MSKSLCRLLILVNHALVAIFNVANMSFYALRENKILGKISGFTVCVCVFVCTLVPLPCGAMGYREYPGESPLISSLPGKALRTLVDIARLAEI